jgi:hypothetical protein
MNMKERVFRKFVSLIPEGIRERLKPFKDRITEVLRE